MIGSGVGTELFRIYWDRSGVGGHCVFSIYPVISGQVGGGGMELLRMYLLMSGAAGQEAWPQERHCTGAPESWNPSDILGNTL